MPLHADLYLDRIDLAHYADAETCQVCRVDSLAELVDRLRSGQVCPGQCPHWPRERVEAFQTAVNAGQTLPTIPSLDIPRLTASGWFELNGPTADSPALITGNSQLTHEVLLAVLSTMTAPMWMVSVDTCGHTVDMSLVYAALTAEAIARAFQADDSRPQEFTGRIILPGLAAGLAAPASRLLARPVEVGPICAAELPLSLGMSGVLLKDFSWERMIAAVDAVRERACRAAAALTQAGIPHAVIGGNAVAAWVSRVDVEAVRNTKDVDLLVRRGDLARLVATLESVGFVHQNVANVDLFLDGPEGSVRSAVRIVYAGERVRPDYLLPAPDVTESEAGPEFAVVKLEALVRMKLTSFRLKDRVHLLDLLEVGLIDESWCQPLPAKLATRLHELIDSQERER